MLKNQVQAHTPIYEVSRLRAAGITVHHLATMGVAAPVADAAVASAAHIAGPVGAGASQLPSPLSAPTLLDRVRYLLFTHGVTGLYRGIGAGTARSMLSNGVSMVVMLRAQQWITSMGWRD